MIFTALKSRESICRLGQYFFVELIKILKFSLQTFFFETKRKKLASYEWYQRVGKGGGENYECSEMCCGENNPSIPRTQYHCKNIKLFLHANFGDNAREED